MPVRKIKANPFSNTGVFYSQKNKRHIRFESTLERDYYMLLELESNVDSYEEQPVTLYFAHYNKQIPYTPDCLVYYKDDTPICILEIKPSKKIKDKKVFLKQKFEQIEKYLHDNDMTFQLITEYDIRIQRLENAKYIYGFADTQYNKEYIDTITKIAKETKEISFIDLLKRCSSDKYTQASYSPYIWHLLYKGVLQIDMDKVISNDTLIRLVHEDA
jgi:hypothetical protein